MFSKIRSKRQRWMLIALLIVAQLELAAYGYLFYQAVAHPLVIIIKQPTY